MTDNFPLKYSTMKENLRKQPTNHLFLRKIQLQSVFMLFKQYVVESNNFFLRKIYIPAYKIWSVRVRRTNVHKTPRREDGVQQPSRDRSSDCLLPVRQNLSASSFGSLLRRQPIPQTTITEAHIFQRTIENFKAHNRLRLSPF